MVCQFGEQNPSFLIIYIHQKANENYWTGEFFIEIKNENLVLYDADYNIQATTWNPFSTDDANRMVFLQKGSGDAINYKLSCLCLKKYMSYVEVSSNTGILPCNRRKKIRIRVDDCTIHNATLKLIINVDKFVRIIPKKCAIKNETTNEQIMKSPLHSFPAYALPKTLENYMKGIGYNEAIMGIEYNKSNEKLSFIKRLISMLIPLIIHSTPLHLMEYDNDNVKIIWESKKQRFILMRQYIEIFKQQVISNYAVKNCSNSD
uniref:Bm1150 n=1 Tax=Brugia malayi TaxID=6279 RepID=A0A0J9Y7I8_BRUMA|nr:Bm1150 [Brugia malayi]